MVLPELTVEVISPLVVFILEKDNHRIQIFSLPELKFIGIIGEVELTAPKCLETIKLRKDKLKKQLIY